MAKISSADAFFTALARSELLGAENVQKLKTSSNGDDGPAVAAKLVSQGQLTPWQAKKLLSGQTSLFLGKYKLLDRLDWGRSGRIFLAQHTQMKSKVALKTLGRRYAGDRQCLELFQKEARLAASLDHEHIIHVYDFGYESDYYFFVMEYIDARMLSDIVARDAPITFSTAADIIRQAAEGLAQAHRQKIVHGQVNPYNLLVDKEGTVKLINVGTAILPTSDEPSTDATEFMPPEQASAGDRDDPRVDIYALGATFFFLLMGKPPLAPGSRQERLKQYRSKNFKQLLGRRADVPPALVETCVKMMAEKPADRFQSAEVIAESLKVWLAAYCQPAAVPPKQEQPVLKTRPQATTDTIDIAVRPTRKSRPASTAGSIRKTASTTSEKSGHAKGKKPAWVLAAAAVATVAVAAVIGIVVLAVWLGSKSKPNERQQVADNSAASAADGPSTEEEDQDKNQGDAKGEDASAGKQPEIDPKTAELEAARKWGFDTEGEGKKLPGEDAKQDPDAGKKQPGAEAAQPGQKDPQTKPEPPAAENPNPGAKPADDPKDKPTPKAKPGKEDPKTTEAEKPKEPAKPQPPPNPFAGLAKVIDLPQASSEGEPGSALSAPLSLGPVTTDKEYFINLVGADPACPGKPSFATQASGKGWDVVLVDGQKAADNKIARLARDDNQLTFIWTPAAKEHREANYLRNCLLELRSGRHVGVVALRQAVAVEPLAITFDKGKMRAELEIPWLPEAENIVIELLGIDGTKAEVTFEPSPPVFTANKGSGKLLLGKENKTLWFEVGSLIGRNNKVTLTAAPYFQLMRGVPPMPLQCTAPNMQGFFMEMTKFENNLNEFLKKTTDQKQKDQIGLKLREVQTAQTLFGELRTVVEALHTNKGHIRYRVAFKIGEHLIELAAPPTAPAAGELPDAPAAGAAP